jgi:PmbA protein
MIVENRAGSRLLRAIQRPMMGRSLQQKNSFLEGMVGKRIASEQLTILDDPFIERGLGSRHFDNEGLAAKRRVMIEKGILRNYYIDNYYGKKLDMEPTTDSPSNVIFEYGSRSPEEMIVDVEKGILVTGFIGGNSNSTTGDFSYGIVGHLIENGKIVKPVNEMNISGNSREFWSRLVEMGNDPYPYSAWRRPSMFFEGVDFSGI